MGWEADGITGVIAAVTVLLVLAYLAFRIRGSRNTGDAAPLNTSKLTEGEFKEFFTGLSRAEWHEVYLAHARGERSDIVPFPSADIQVVTNGKQGQDTAKGAISILNCIMECVDDLATPNESISKKRVLDYGCGWGRITRLLPFYFDVDGIVGVDVDERLINNANNLLPHLHHQKISSMERLPFQDESFDIVFANSVFSHLSEKSAMFTLGELSRILSSRGMIIISTLGEANLTKFYSHPKRKNVFMKEFGSQEEAMSLLEDRGFIWFRTRRWHEYGIAIVKDEWIAQSFDSNALQYCGTKRGERTGTQNYNFGRKLTARETG